MSGASAAAPASLPEQQPLRRPRPERTRGWSLSGEQIESPPAASRPDQETGSVGFARGGPTSRVPDGFRLTPTRIPDPRTTLVEKLAFVLAVVLAPVGLLASVAAAAASARRRGWVPGLVSAGIVVGAVLTLALGAVAVVVDGLASDAVQQRATVAESQPMCRAIRVAGLDATGADFGWPAPGDSIASTVTGIQGYVDRWTEVAALAPAAVKTDAASIVSTATEIGSSIAGTRTIDDAGNTARMQSVRTQSGLPAWVLGYCR